MRKRVEDDLLTYSDGGFASLAVVSQRYRIRDGLLHTAASGVSRTYKPFSEVRLPNALAGVTDEDLSPDPVIAVRKFASEFGELGYSRLVRATLLPSFSASLPKSEQWKSAHVAYQKYRDAIYVAARGLPDGDPLDWFLAHSRTVNLCLKFIGLLNEGADRHALQEEVEGVMRGPYAVRDQISSLPVNEWRQALREGVGPSIIIRRTVCDLITENISGVHRRLVTDPSGMQSDSLFLCNATIEAVYWQLADKMEAQMVRRCAECRRFFVARDKRQQYCPPQPGSTRSRCSSRLNVQNHRGRQEGQEAIEKTTKKGKAR